METSSEETVVKKFFDIVSRITGKKPSAKGVGYFTDAAKFVPALGAPFIICGPGNPKLNHKVDEWVEIEKMVESTRIYIQTAMELLG